MPHKLMITITKYWTDNYSKEEDQYKLNLEPFSVALRNLPKWIEMAATATWAKTLCDSLMLGKFDLKYMFKES